VQVHAHLIEWYVLAIDGKPVYEEYPELYQAPKDVFQIGADVGTMHVAARFGPSLGRYLVRPIATQQFHAALWCQLGFVV
jgi:hypothetical protein